MLNKQDIISKKITSLSLSKFRSSFHLTKKDISYIEKQGLNKICQDTYDIINKRLAPQIITNDGKQTPYHGHPAFIAQHATGCCCRSCLYKWHHIPPNKSLTTNEINYVVALIMTWIIKEYNKK